jgi:mono/diheme cytochrome c family protein
LGSAAVAQQPAGGQSVQAGARVFRAAGCIVCHAADGLGGQVGPDLGAVGGRSMFDFAAAMWNHLPRMAGEMRAREIPRPVLDPWETGDLMAFLFWLEYFEQPGDTARGRLLFGEKGCIRCHQVHGSGGVLGPNLDHLAEASAPIQVAAAMWNHGPAMTVMMRGRGIPRPQFTGSELNDLVAYLEAASPSMPTGPLYVTPGRPAVGARLFEDKACIECHRVGDRGGVVGPELGSRRPYESLVDFAAAMWNKTPRMLAAMRQRGIDVPQLAPDEMSDLIAYLYAGRYFDDAGQATRGRAHVRAKNCLECHQLDGRGGTGAGDLADARGLDSPAAVVAALWNHVGVVEPARGWTSLTAAEIADVAAFLQQLGGAQ